MSRFPWQLPEEKRRTCFWLPITVILVPRVMFLLFIFVPAVTSTDIKFGVVVDTRLSKARTVVDFALQDLAADAPTSTPPFTYTYSYDDSGTCSAGSNMQKSVFTLTEFYSKDNILAVFGPTCFTDLQIAARLTDVWDILQFNFWTDHPSDTMVNNIVQMTTRSTNNIAQNIYAFCRGVDWIKIALIQCRDCYPSQEEQATVERIQNITLYLKKNGIQIVATVNVFRNSTVDYYKSQMTGFSQITRVVLPFVGSTLDNYSTLQLAMRQLNYSTDDYSTLIVLSDFQVDGMNAPWANDETLKAAFQKSVVLYNNMNMDASTSTKVTDFISRTGVPKEQVQTYIQLYEAVFVYNTVLTASQTSGTATDYKASSLLDNMDASVPVKGPFGSSITFNKIFNRISPYIVYIIDNGTMSETVEKITPGSCAESVSQCLKYVAPKAGLNAGQPTCGFYGELCDQTGTVMIIAAVMSTVFVSVGFFIGLKRLRQKTKNGGESAMPWVIPYNSIRLLDLGEQAQHNPLVAEHMSILSLQRHMDETVKQRSMMSSSVQMATLQQQLVLVEKYMQREKISFDKSEVQLLFAVKQLQHDNINPFLGMCFDKSTHLYIIWGYGFRGSLMHWIFEKKDPRTAKAEKNFREAFVRDLLKSIWGLDYIHSSAIGYHGGLSPSVCYIDTHWILKISGFGIPRMLYRWKNSNIVATVDSKPLIPNNELHYHAPELRRRLKSLMYTNRTEFLNLSAKEGQAADMYTFGVILYEILHVKKMVDMDDYIRTDMNEEDALILCEQAEALLPNTTPVEDELMKEVHNDLKKLIISCWATNIDTRPDCMMARKITDATLKMTGSLVDQMLRNMESYTMDLEGLVKQRTAQLEEAQQKADGLLAEMLPKSIADDLKRGKPVEAKHYKSVTIMYSDIVGFTSLCSESLPMEVVALLSQLFDKFDSIITMHDGFKMETIGDAYCVASGMPTENKQKHVANIANIALKQRKFMTEFEIPHRPGQYLHCRWGFNTGPLFSGVIGRRAPRYASFGRTVLIAAKMENLGIPDKIQMTFDSYKLLTTHHPEFICTPREGGAVSVPGIGYLLTYWLEGVEDLLRTDREIFERALDDLEKKEEKDDDPYFIPDKPLNTVSSASAIRPQFTSDLVYDGKD